MVPFSKPERKAAPPCNSTLKSLRGMNHPGLSYLVCHIVQVAGQMTSVIADFHPRKMPKCGCSLPCAPALGRPPCPAALRGGCHGHHTARHRQRNTTEQNSSPCASGIPTRRNNRRHPVFGNDDRHPSNLSSAPPTRMTCWNSPANWAPRRKMLEKLLLPEKTAAHAAKGTMSVLRLSGISLIPRTHL